MAKKKPKPKPRRDFRAWLVHQLQSQGAQIPDDPTYKQLHAALSTRGLRPSA